MSMMSMRLMKRDGSSTDTNMRKLSMKIGSTLFSIHIFIHNVLKVVVNAAKPVFPEMVIGILVTESKLDRANPALMHDM